jgi:hypothetical protein
MEHRDRNQEPAGVYQRLGWTVRDSDPGAEDQRLGDKVEIKLACKKGRIEPDLLRKPDA